MSKQSDAKFEQGYQDKPVFPMCSNCENFQFDLVEFELSPGFVQRRNLRCGIGLFAVKKQGNCNLHKFK